MTATPRTLKRTPMTFPGYFFVLYSVKVVSESPSLITGKPVSEQHSGFRDRAHRLYPLRSRAIALDASSRSSSSIPASTIESLGHEEYKTSVAEHGNRQADILLGPSSCSSSGQPHGMEPYQRGGYIGRRFLIFGAFCFAAIPVGIQAGRSA